MAYSTIEFDAKFIIPEDYMVVWDYLARNQWHAALYCLMPLARTSIWHPYFSSLAYFGFAKPRVALEVLSEALISFQALKGERVYYELQYLHAYLNIFQDTQAAIHEIDALMTEDPSYCRTLELFGRLQDHMDSECDEEIILATIEEYASQRIDLLRSMWPPEDYRLRSYYLCKAWAIAGTPELFPFVEENILAYSPDSSEVFRLLAYNLAKNDKHEECAAMADHMMELDPYKVSAYILKAHSLFALDNTSAEAERACWLALDMQEEEQALQLLCYFKARPECDWERVISLSDRLLLTQSIPDARLLSYKGEALIGLGRWDEVKQLVDLMGSIEFTTVFESFYQLLVRTTFETGRHDWTWELLHYLAPKMQFYSDEIAIWIQLLDKRASDAIFIEDWPLAESMAFECCDFERGGYIEWAAAWADSDVESDMESDIDTSEELEYLEIDQ